MRQRLQSALQDALAATAKPQARVRLLRQWLLYYTEAFAPTTTATANNNDNNRIDHHDEIPRARLPGTILVEKTPENFLLAPMLRRLEGSSCSSLLVTVRHPLVWALVSGRTSGWGTSRAASTGANMKTAGPLSNMLVEFAEVAS